MSNFLHQYPHFSNTLGAVLIHFPILVMGKTEGRSTDWHGHVTALTVGPNYRRLGLARTLMAELERITQDVANGYFVDLFVRMSNEIAIGMYRGLGYSVFRRIVAYYSGFGGGPGNSDEDAYGEYCLSLEVVMKIAYMRDDSIRYAKADEEGQVTAKYTRKRRKLLCASGKCILLRNL